MKFLLRALACCLIFSQSVFAASKVEGLFEAEVLVPEGSSSDLNSPLIAEALRRVLIKATGVNEFSDNDEVLDALSQARSYVREFGFHSIDVPFNDHLKLQSGVQVTTQRVMRVAFLRGAVLQLIRRSGLPLWSANRPDVLLWLAFDDYQQQIWVTPELATDLARHIREIADQRGIPVNFPLADIEDDFVIQPKELLNGDYSSLGAASARYSNDLLLAGHAVQTSSGTWIGGWRFNVDGKQSEFQILGANKEEFLSLGINRLADALAQKYAVVSDAQHTSLRLRVLGLNDYAQYSQINSYLNSITAIEKANLEIVEGDIVVFRLDLKGSLEQFENAVLLDQKMRPEAQQNLTQTFDLQYRWMESANE